MLYMPVAQLTNPRGDRWHSFGMTLAARTQTDPASVVSAIGNVVHEVDADAPLLNVKTMEDTVNDSLLQQRFTMFLLVGFAALALLLAAIGIYSVLSYMVRRRVREIGIRMALGAQLSDVLRMIVSEGMKPTLIGVVIGLAGALALGRVMASVIYGVSARDLMTLVSVAVLMTVIGLVASALPAYRATRVDPMKTLREE
jgi:ABC-type antimicrobial peptide transport system permease subunit